MKNPLSYLAGVFLLAAVSFAVPAKATILHVEAVGGTYSMAGNVTIANVINAVGGYDILSLNSFNVTGPVSGPATLVPNPNQPFTSLYPAPGGHWTFNNNLYSTAVPFDIDGLLLTFGGIIGNLYTLAGLTYFSTTTPSGLFIPGDLMTVSVTQTPLPGAVVLFASGLACLGFLGRRKKKSLSKPVAA